jgi:hypothetical protein
MVTNFFVLSRVRQAYESIPNTMLPAQKWQEQGSAPTAFQVFGVTDLDVRKTGGDESVGELRYRASYTLWIPAEVDADTSPDPALLDTPPADSGAEFSIGNQVSLPRAYPLTDELTLVKRKDNWHIAGLERTGAL